MAGIVFWFQEKDRDVFSGSRIDLDAWRYAAKAGGIDKARCINQTDQHLHFDGDFDFEIIGKNANDLRDWLENQENAIIFQCQWSCPDDAIPMRAVDHTKVDWYVFGEGNSTPPNLKGQYVYMPQCDKGGLHPVHAASAAMLRRWEELIKVNNNDY